jgi:hypothetical protein
MLPNSISSACPPARPFLMNSCPVIFAAVFVVSPIGSQANSPATTHTTGCVRRRLSVRSSPAHLFYFYFPFGHVANWGGKWTKGGGGVHMGGWMRKVKRILFCLFSSSPPPTF